MAVQQLGKSEVVIREMEEEKERVEDKLREAEIEIHELKQQLGAVQEATLSSPTFTKKKKRGCA